MKTTRVKFTNTSKILLAGHLDRPETPPKAYALFAHCFTCGKDLKSAVFISRRLAEREIAVLRFDFTGLGESQGEFADSNFSTNLQDLIAAADFLRETHQAPEILIGHSLGGTAVLAAAQRIPEARAVATIAAPASTGGLAEKLVRQAPQIETQEEAQLVLAGRSFRIKKQLLEDLNTHEMHSIISNLDLPLLIFHSPADNIVSIDHARRIFEAAKHPKSFISLDQADHLLLNPKDAQLVAHILAGWAERYL